MMVVMPSKNPPVSPLFGAATLNASLSPVKRDLTSIEVKQPSSSQSVSGTIHGLLKPRVRFFVFRFSFSFSLPIPSNDVFPFLLL